MYLLLPDAIFVVATAIVLESCRVAEYSSRFFIGLIHAAIARVSD
jgi:hypothetical protein